MRRNRDSPSRRACPTGLGIMLLALLAAPAGAQEAARPQDAPPQATGLPPAESGFIGAVGRFIKRSLGPLAPEDPTPPASAPPVAEAPVAEAPVAAVPPPAPAATSPLEVSRGLAKDAIDAVKRLPSSVALPQLPSAMVTGRERCVAAANGAPDCLAATEALCKSKGFKTGNSLDIQSARRCKAHVWLSGRPAEADDCTTESFVTRAMCR